MTNQPTKRRTSPLIVWPVCLFVFVVLYFASYGPFLWSDVHNVLPESTCDVIYHTVYFPIGWIGSNTGFFNDSRLGQTYMEYLDWWAGRPSAPARPI